ncbi:MAG: hypothetical protein UT61_C0058G0001, partial [Candidatus Woesebacteria bacterium GW2011_GWA1_39_8]
MRLLQKQADEAEVVVRIFGAEELADRGKFVKTAFAHSYFSEGAVNFFEPGLRNAAAQIVNVVIWILLFYFFHMVQNGAQLQSPCLGD